MTGFGVQVHHVFQRFYCAYRWHGPLLRAAFDEVVARAGGALLMTASGGRTAGLPAVVGGWDIFASMCWDGGKSNLNR